MYMFGLQDQHRESLVQCLELRQYRYMEEVCVRHTFMKRHRDIIRGLRSSFILMKLTFSVAMLTDTMYIVFLDNELRDL